MKIKLLKSSKYVPAKLLKLPLFSSGISAGFPSPADGEVEQYLDLNELIVQHPAATYYVRVEGDSMQGAGIFSGDILVVDRSLPPANGKIIVAFINGEFTVKRLVKEGSSIYLKPENPAYKTLKVDSESDFQVWGIVTYVIHKPV